MGSPKNGVVAIPQAKAEEILVYIGVKWVTAM
jgi:hypothetical protein